MKKERHPVREPDDSQPPLKEPPAREIPRDEPPIPKFPVEEPPVPPAEKPPSDEPVIDPLIRDRARNLFAADQHLGFTLETKPPDSAVSC